MTANSVSSETSNQRLIFLVSAVGLFLELALIRWVSCEVRIFAYFKNMVLVACFLGFGTGCLLSNKPSHVLRGLLLLLLLCLVIQLPWQPLTDYGPRRISRILAEMPGLMIFRSADTVVSWQNFWGLSFAVAWTVLLFLLLAMIMVPLGQITASAMAKMRVISPLNPAKSCCTRSLPPSPRVSWQGFPDCPWPEKQATMEWWSTFFVTFSLHAIPRTQNRL